jgi:hypothetical protein
MPELDLVRTIAPDTPGPSIDAYVRARAKMLERIDDELRGSRRRRRSLVLLPVGAALVAASLAAVIVGLPTLGKEDTASAASGVLHKAAAVARHQPAPPPLRPGEFVYTRSVNAYLSTYALGDGKPTFSALVPHVREAWLAPDGTGWLVQTGGKAEFLSPRDREDWIAAGRPVFGNEDMDLALNNSDGPNVPMVTLSLPSDPDRLYARIKRDAGSGGSRLQEEMFTLVGDALRETHATPAQRAALYEVAARIPGVELVGETTDRAHRPGIAVAMRDEENRTRQMLIFDPETAELLGEEETAIDGNSWGFPDGTVIGYATYLESAVVDKIKERP